MGAEPGAAVVSPADTAALWALLAHHLCAWNARDAEAFADALTPDAVVVGFDGSVMEGRDAVRSTIASIFAHHATGRYVWLPRRLRLLTPDVAALTAMVGLVPAGRDDVDPALNAVQTAVAVRTGDAWHLAVFQNTPAQFHGRPEAAAALTAELRAALQRPGQSSQSEQSG